MDTDENYLENSVANSMENSRDYTGDNSVDNSVGNDGNNVENETVENNVGNSVENTVADIVENTAAENAAQVENTVAENEAEIENNVDNTDDDDKFILTAEMVKSLKCSLCDLCLSIPPVYIISEDGMKYRCGRCSIKTYVNTRAVMYENLAKFMYFPCIYKNCTEKLAWGAGKDHEKTCPHRTIMCNTLDCEESVLAKDFSAHFKEKHNNIFFQDSMTIKNITSSYGMGILEKEEQCYVVLYDYDHAKFGVRVYGFDSTNKQFEATFKSSRNNKLSITVSEQSITKFSERKHCYRCLKGTCKCEFHIYKYHRKGLLKSMNGKIDRDSMRRTFGSSPVDCIINVVDEKVHDELEELLMGKDMIIDEVNDDEEEVEAVEAEENDLLKQLLICPVCKEPMASPIYQCLSGHTLCNTCKSKSENCSECQTRIDSTRNYILEEVAANLKLATQDETTEANQADKEITCPMNKCFDTIKVQSIGDHFKEKHIDNFHFNNFLLKNVYAHYNINVLIRKDKTYLMFFDFDDVHFGISVCSLDKDSLQYEVKLSSSNGRYSVTTTGQKIIKFNEKDHCFKCSIGTCKNKDHTYRSRRKELFRKLTTKINRDGIRRIFGSNHMDYRINIVEVKDNSFQDKMLRQMFECPICKDYMTSPIHQCIAGHTLCGSCKSKLEKCPSCEGKIEETRNYLLEELAEKAEITCLYEQESCSFRAGVKRIASHEAECPLKTKKAKEAVEEVKAE